MQAWTGQVKSPLASSTALVGQGSGSKRPCGKVSPRMAAARMQRRPRRKQLSKRGCERWVVRRRAMFVAGRSAKVLTGRLSSASPATLRTHSVATAMASHRRAARAGSTIFVCCHCQPPRLVSLNPHSIQARRLYQQTSACSEARSVRIATDRCRRRPRPPECAARGRL